MTDHPHRSRSLILTLAIVLVVVGDGASGALTVSSDLYPENRFPEYPAGLWRHRFFSALWSLMTVSVVWVSRSRLVPGNRGLAPPAGSAGGTQPLQ